MPGIQARKEKKRLLKIWSVNSLGTSRSSCSLPALMARSEPAHSAGKRLEPGGRPGACNSAATPSCETLALRYVSRALKNEVERGTKAREIRTSRRRSCAAGVRPSRRNGFTDGRGVASVIVTASFHGNDEHHHVETRRRRTDLSIAEIRSTNVQIAHSGDITDSNKQDEHGKNRRHSLPESFCRSPVAGNKSSNSKSDAARMVAATI